jgi:hypothetical protein
MSSKSTPKQGSQKTEKTMYNTFRLEQREGSSYYKPPSSTNKNPPPPPKLTTLNKVQNRMSSLESTLNSLVPTLREFIEEKERKKQQEEEDINLGLTPWSQLNNNQPKPFILYTDFQNPDMTKKLISLFFTLHEYDGYPRIIQLSEFLGISRDYNQLHPSLVYSLLSYSARYSDHPDLAGKNLAAAKHYYDLASSHLDWANSDGNIGKIQCLMLLGSIDLLEGKLMKGWFHFSIAIRMAQMLNLHNVDNPNCSEFLNKSEDYLKMVRRVWHLCLIADDMISKLIKRPRMIDGEHNPEYLIPYSFSNHQVVQTTMGELPNYIKRSLQSSQNLLKLTTEIAMQTALLNDADRRQDVLNELGILSVKLERWYLDIPPALHYKTSYLIHDNRVRYPYLDQLVLQFFFYLAAKLQLYRPVLEIAEDILTHPVLLNIIPATISTCDRIVQVLQDWVQVASLTNVNFPDTPTPTSPPFVSLYYTQAGECYLAALHCARLLHSHSSKFNNTSAPVEAIVLNQALTSYNMIQKKFKTLIDLLKLYQDNWDGAKQIAEKLIEQFETQFGERI